MFVVAKLRTDENQSISIWHLASHFVLWGQKFSVSFAIFCTTAITRYKQHRKFLAVLIAGIEIFHVCPRFHNTNCIIESGMNTWNSISVGEVIVFIANSSRYMWDK